MDCARNIITANFSGGGTSTTTAPLWQWDYGQVLCITGLDLPAAFEVHFSTNRTGGVSTVAVGADGQVTIPNVLLTIGKNLNAWIYLSDSEGEGETEYSILIPVKARPMPETYDAEVTGEFDDVVRQVSEYAETAQAAANNAGASASAAAAFASEAAASASAAETAKIAAETAQGKAEDAQATAETAAQTATEKAQQTAQDTAQAAQSKTDAESAAQRAEAAQTGAESAKTDAETAAQSAADSASAASTSATSAGQSATSAGQSATAAAGSATTAGNAAQTATTKAAEAFASADAAAASETAAQTAQTAAETAAGTAAANATTATTKAAEAAQSATDAAASETAAEAAATRAEQAAASLTVDSALSDTSTNPVQNKVITGAITDVKSAIAFDETLYAPDGIVDKNNLILGRSMIGRGCHYFGHETVEPNYFYISVPVAAGVSYTFLWVRFISSDDEGLVNNTGYNTPHTWTATLTGDVYLSIKYENIKKAYFCASSDYTNSDFGTGEAPLYNASTLAQSEGQSTKKPVSQKLLADSLTNVRSEINQIYPINIDVGETTAGYYIYRNGNPMGGDENSSVTDFVSVLPGHSIYATQIYCTGNRCVCAYDKDKQLTRVLTSNTGNDPLSITLNRDEYYIRLTAWKTTIPKVVYTDELAPTDIEYLEERNATIEYHFDKDITAFHILRGFFVASDGSYVKDNNSVVIDKIPIQSGKSFTVKDVVLAGSRSICAYDSNGDFVSVLTTNQGTTAKSFKYKNDGTYAFVSITQTISIRSELPTIEYVDAFAEISDGSIGEKRSIFDSDFIEFWNEQIESGYIDWNGTTVVADSGYRHTPYIPVTGGRTIEIKNFYSAAVRYLFAYDENKNVRYVPVASSSASVASYEYELPIDVYYIRYNLNQYQIDTTSIEYKDADVYKWSRERYYSQIVEKWFRRTSNAISTPFATATTAPVITLIDDDTISVEAVQRYYNACVANDVKGGYAVLTANLEDNETLKNLLLQYEDKGFSMNIHAYSQVNAFNYGETRDIVVAEANFCKGLRQMREFGFLDYMYWCTPYGVSDSDIQDVARRHGIKCLIRSGINNAYVGTNAMNRFAIPRASLNNNDTALQQVKTLVDRIAVENGWLLVTTHMFEDSWASDTSRFTDFVTYAKNKGCVFKTISEAWTERQYIFDLYSTL